MYFWKNFGWLEKLNEYKMPTIIKAFGRLPRESFSHKTIRVQPRYISNQSITIILFSQKSEKNILRKHRRTPVTPYVPYKWKIYFGIIRKKYS